MLAPSEVKKAAKQKEDENLRFRTFLKINAEEKELDERFARLHAELFKGYDCNKCRNCCKAFPGEIPKEELEKDAGHLQITKEQMIDFFLKPLEFGGYRTKHIPCDFLRDDGSCMLGDYKPENCKNYPYTNQPERLHSLFSVLDVIEVCPVAFEIFERLKDEYGFRSKRGKNKSHKRGKKSKAKSFESENFGVYQDENFAFIAGHTEWGFPYGITWEEAEKNGLNADPDMQIPFRWIDDDELPF